MKLDTKRGKETFSEFSPEVGGGVSSVSSSK